MLRLEVPVGQHRTLPRDGVTRLRRDLKKPAHRCARNRGKPVQVPGGMHRSSNLEAERLGREPGVRPDRLQRPQGAAQRAEDLPQVGAGAFQVARKARPPDSRVEQNSQLGGPPMGRGTRTAALEAATTNAAASMTSRRSAHSSGS